MTRRTDLYQLDGVRVPSVTEILNLAGLVDYSKVQPEYLERARASGSLMHEWIHLLTEGHISADDEPPPEIAGEVKAYLRFVAESGFQATASEQVVVNPVLRYAGTFDLRGTLGGVDALIDLKRMTSVCAWVKWQLAGYALCLDPRPKRFALRLLSNGTYRLDPYRERSDEQDWLAAVRVAHMRLALGAAHLED